MSNTAPRRESVQALIVRECETCWQHSMGRNYHALYVKSDGTLYWSERINRDEWGEAEYFGRQRDYWHLTTVGLGASGWNGADHEVYATREITPAEQAEIDAALSEWPREREVKLASGEIARRSEGRHTGYAPDAWYVQTGELLSFDDANPDASREDQMADALAAIDEIPVGFFDDERDNPGEEWEAMKR